MKLLGKVTNVIHDGTILVRASQTPSIGVNVYDSSGSEVGRVVRIFGPVSEPYVSLKTSDGVNSFGLIGTMLYTGLEGAKSTERRRIRTRSVEWRQNPKHPVKGRGVNKKWQGKEKPRKR